MFFDVKTCQTIKASELHLAVAIAEGLVQPDLANLCIMVIDTWREMDKFLLREKLASIRIDRRIPDYYQQ